MSQRETRATTGKKVVFVAILLPFVLVRAVTATNIFGLEPRTGLVNIETEPFSVSRVGVAGFPSLSGLDFQPGTGTLFASAGYQNDGWLYTVDPMTGDVGLETRKAVPHDPPALVTSRAV